MHSKDAEANVAGDSRSHDGRAGRIPPVIGVAGGHEQASATVGAR